MTILDYDINSPDPTATEWGPDVTQIRDNIASLTMYSAANGGRLPDWDSVYTYNTGDLEKVTLTNKTYTSIKIELRYAYVGGFGVGGDLNKESYYFDKGLGGGWELVTNGVLTYGYTTGDLTTVTAGAT